MLRPTTFPSPSWLLTAVLVLAIVVPGFLAAAFGESDGEVALTPSLAKTVLGTPAQSPESDLVEPTLFGVVATAAAASLDVALPLEAGTQRGRWLE